MGVILLSIVTAIYLGISVTYCYSGKLPLAGMFLGYAIANCFLIWGSLGE